MYCKLVICIIWLSCANGQFSNTQDYEDKENKKNSNNNNYNRESRLGSTQIKQYTGIKLFNDTRQMVYYHDDTIAVVEIDSQSSLRNCELIEIFNEKHGRETLEHLKKSINKPLHVTFSEITDLMDKCELLDEIEPSISFIAQGIYNSAHLQTATSQSTSTNYFIMPGTKWCGAGDVAKTYFDLGEERKMDMCCRKHDLCPVKIRSYSTRYSLSNKSFSTKSHCHCDDELSSCLKKIKTTTANSMGNIYFNVFKIQCIEDSPNGKRFRSSHPY